MALKKLLIISRVLYSRHSCIGFLPANSYSPCGNTSGDVLTVAVHLLLSSRIQTNFVLARGWPMLTGMRRIEGDFGDQMKLQMEGWYKPHWHQQIQKKEWLGLIYNCIRILKIALSSLGNLSNGGCFDNSHSTIQYEIIFAYFLTLNKKYFLRIKMLFYLNVSQFIKILLIDYSVAFWKWLF